MRPQIEDFLDFRRKKVSRHFKKSTFLRIPKRRASVWNADPRIYFGNGCGKGHLVPKRFFVKNSGNLEIWQSGILEIWNSGNLEFWHKRESNRVPTGSESLCQPIGLIPRGKYVFMRHSLCTRNLYAIYMHFCHFLFSCSTPAAPAQPPAVLPGLRS